MADDDYEGAGGGADDVYDDEPFEDELLEDIDPELDDQTQLQQHDSMDVVPMNGVNGDHAEVIITAITVFLSCVGIVLCFFCLERGLRCI